MFDIADSSTNLIGVPAHGGSLIDRQLQGEARDAALERARTLLRVPLSLLNISDLEMIAIGAYSPLIGFMERIDYECVLKEMRLANDLVWSLPITLAIPDNLPYTIKKGQEIALVQGVRILAIMKVTDKFLRDRQREARLVFGTDSVKHPGVQRLYQEGDIVLGGDIQLLNWPNPDWFSTLRQTSTPKQTRKKFAENKWKRIVGFQTRNPIHRGHEYVFKNALEITDGLLLHPLVGDTKPDDISAEIRIKSYQIFLKYYYPSKHAVLGVFPAPMRYAGPREAIFHALCRKNYGCTHFIVGRDHAGVGNFYDPQAGIDIFSRFRPDEIGIEILSYAPTSYCRQCKSIVTPKTCPHENERFYMSGSEIRDLLKRGKMPPKEIMRPEMSGLLLELIFGRRSADYYFKRTIDILKNDPQAPKLRLGKRIAGVIHNSES